MTAAAPSMLVTGLPRSGTSWVGKMLEAGRQVVYINEPMSMSRPPGHSPGVLDARVRHRFQYIADGADDAWVRAFGDTLRLRFRPIRELGAVRSPYHLARGAKYGLSFARGALTGRRAMLDDPNAVFAARWLGQVMGVRVLFLVRDPVSWTASWRKLGWRPPLADLLAQPDLMGDLLAGREAQIRRALDDGDWLEQMCCLWTVTNDMIHEVAAAADPARVTVRRYEDLAADPVDGFRDLYAWFGLSWTARVEQLIEQATSSSTAPRAFSWTLRGGISRTAYQPMDSRAASTRPVGGLQPAEIERVRELTGAAAARFPRTTA